MKNLTVYVENKNRWNAIFKQKPWDLSNSKDLQAIYESLECDLSPENLTCDGEIRGRALQTKAAHLKGAMAELKKLADLNDITLKELDYGF